MTVDCRSHGTSRATAVRKGGGPLWHAIKAARDASSSTNFDRILMPRRAPENRSKGKRSYGKDDCRKLIISLEGLPTIVRNLVFFGTRPLMKRHNRSGGTSSQGFRSRWNLK